MAKVEDRKTSQLTLQEHALLLLLLGLLVVGSLARYYRYRPQVEPASEKSPPSNLEMNSPYAED